MKKAIVILAEGFEEIEAVTPIDILRRAGVDVTIAGLSSVSIKGSRGVTISADSVLSSQGIGFDAVVLPGGMPGAANLAASEEAGSIIKAVYIDIYQMIFSFVIINIIIVSPYIG